MQNDVIKFLGEKISDWIASQPDKFYLLPIRLAVIFAAILILCSVSYFRTNADRHQQSDFAGQQIMLAVVGFLIGVVFPIHVFVSSRAGLKSSIFIAASVACILLPLIFPFFVTPIAGWQKRISKGAYVFTGTALLLTFFI
jgi:cell division protein FtsW (lipid II flippase)